MYNSAGWLDWSRRIESIDKKDADIKLLGRSGNGHLNGPVIINVDAPAELCAVLLQITLFRRKSIIKMYVYASDYSI